MYHHCIDEKSIRIFGIVILHMKRRRNLANHSSDKTWFNFLRPKFECKIVLKPPKRTRWPSPQQVIKMSLSLSPKSTLASSFPQPASCPCSRTPRPRSCSPSPSASSCPPTTAALSSGRSPSSTSSGQRSRTPSAPWNKYGNCQGAP